MAPGKATVNCKKRSEFDNSLLGKLSIISGRSAKNAGGETVIRLAFVKLITGCLR